MLDNYLEKLDDFILAADEIIKVDIIRRTIWDTNLERIALYRYKIYFHDESLLELTERLIEEKGTLKITKYRFHWQDREGRLIKRWDNAKHHPEVDTFPSHLHDGSEKNVIAHTEISGLEVLSNIIKEISKGAV